MNVIVVTIFNGRESIDAFFLNGFKRRALETPIWHRSVYTNGHKMPVRIHV
jgi:hypothetical protein